MSADAWISPSFLYCWGNGLAEVHTAEWGSAYQFAASPVLVQGLPGEALQVAASAEGGRGGLRWLQLQGGAL